MIGWGILMVGVGVAVGIMVGVGVAVGNGVGVDVGTEGVGVTVGTVVGVGVAVGMRVGVGVAVGTAVGVGVTLGVGTAAWRAANMLMRLQVTVLPAKVGTESPVVRISFLTSASVLAGVWLMIAAARPTT